MNANAARLSSPPAPARGVACALAAYFCWGLFPLFWKLLASVDALELIAHRHAWSLAFVGLLLLGRPGARELRAALGNPRLLAWTFAAGAVLTLNWLIFVWGVNNARVLECSLGYFLLPLGNVLLGRFALGERLSRIQTLALGVAAAGVGVLVARVGSVPWVALGIVFTWGPYSLLKKRAALPALPGFALETLLLSPFAIGLLLWLAFTGRGALGHAPAHVELLVIASGAVTALPLLLFAEGARNLRLTTLGLLQYVVPSMQFVLGWAVFNEPLSTERLAAFGLIWTGLALYSADLLRPARAASRLR